MKPQLVEKPIARESITLTLSPAEQDALSRCLGAASLHQHTIQDACYLVNLSNKLKFLLPNSGGACLPPDQPPVAVMGQEGSL